MPELQQDTLKKRQVAYKVKICDVLDGVFTKDYTSSGYININNINISRVNIIATVVYKSEKSVNSSMVVDDGTGKVLLRSFDNANLFSKIDVGDFVLVIGRIREFNNEKFIIPEILKKIDDMEWVNVRKLELRNKNLVDNNTKVEDKNLIQEVSSFNEDVYSLIKRLDSADGVSVDDIVKIYNDKGVENIINKLLENGDIFEVKPGKLKVLE